LKTLSPAEPVLEIILDSIIIGIILLKYLMRLFLG